MKNHDDNCTMRPKFSVIVPCWNAERTLDETIQSLLQQSISDWEAVLVDDGSTDMTPQIISASCASDSRFRRLLTPKMGPSAARNLAALTHAKGEYLAFLDSDDIWLPHKLEASLRRLESNQKLAGVYGQISFFRTSPSTPETFSTVYPHNLAVADFLRDNPICTMSNLVLRKSCFVESGGFDERIVHNEDVELLVRIALAGGIIGGIDSHLVCYRTNISGLSADINQMRSGWHRALETIQSSTAPLAESDVAAADAGNLRYLARRALRTGAPGYQALRLALTGAFRSPKSFFDPPWRGGMTLLAAVIFSALPRSFRKGG